MISTAAQMNLSLFRYSGRCMVADSVRQFLRRSDWFFVMCFYAHVVLTCVKSNIILTT